MIDIDQELQKYGLNREKYELCLKDIKDKINGSNDMDWAEIVAKYEIDCHSDTLRKASQTIFGGKFVADYFAEKNAVDTASEGYLAQLRLEKEEVKKERQKLSDERTDYQRSLREQARRESFLEVIERGLTAQITPLDYKETPVINNDEDMIVCLSDLHAGIEVKNWWNTYDINILRSRLCKYIDEIKAIQAIHQCHRCELVLGGDAISGLIHPNLRLQNNENVIEQIKTAITYIGEFIAALQDSFSEIRVHSVSGNHSRLSPDKAEHLSGEELDALIPFCLKMKFAKNTSVVIHEDGYIDNSINSFVTRGGKLFYLVHGDKDTPSNAVKNLTLMTGTKPDAVLMAHRHHNAYDTQYGVKVIQMGCVVGTDDHCVDLRISGEPEQCVIITTRERTVKCLYDISLK